MQIDILHHIMARIPMNYLGYGSIPTQSGLLIRLFLLTALNLHNGQWTHPLGTPCCVFNLLAAVARFLPERVRCAAIMENIYAVYLSNSFFFFFLFFLLYHMYAVESPVDATEA